MNKIDLIIECMDQILNDELPTPENMMRAFQYACELRELKPVGIRYNYFGTVVSPYSDGLFDRLEKYPDIELQKLYALDEVTK
jgi:hypothetical protein